MNRWRQRGQALLLLALVVVFGGCSPPTQVSPSPVASLTPSASPSPAASPSQVVLEIQGKRRALGSVSSRLTFPAVASNDRWTLQAHGDGSRLIINLVGQLRDWNGKTFPCTGEWNGQAWKGQVYIEVTDKGSRVQGFVNGQLEGQKLSGRFHAPLETLALP